MPTFGRAGGSLENPDFLSNAETAQAGRAGELATAAILEKLSRERGFAVLHDLRIPNAKANIDHIVVAGDQVTIIDSKMWKPGFYWTLGGKTRRGFEPVPHADKRGIPLAHTRITEMLDGLNLAPRMQRPLMVIHPSRRDGKLSIWAFRPTSDPGTVVRAVHPAQLRFPAKPGNARIVAALTRLVI